MKAKNQPETQLKVLSALQLQLTNLTSESVMRLCIEAFFIMNSPVPGLS